MIDTAFPNTGLAAFAAAPVAPLKISRIAAPGGADGAQSQGATAREAANPPPRRRAAEVPPPPLDPNTIPGPPPSFDTTPLEAAFLPQPAIPLDARDLPDPVIAEADVVPEDPRTEATPEARFFGFTEQPVPPQVNEMR